MDCSSIPRIEERHGLRPGQGPANGLEYLMAERLLISVWLPREHRDSHSLRYASSTLIPFGSSSSHKRPNALRGWAKPLRHVRQVKLSDELRRLSACWSPRLQTRAHSARTTTSRLWTLSSHLAPGRRALSHHFKVVTRNRRLPGRTPRCWLPIGSPQIFPIRLELPVVECVQNQLPVCAMEQQHGPVQGEAVVQGWTTVETRRKNAPTSCKSAATSACTGCTLSAQLRSALYGPPHRLRRWIDGVPNAPVDVLGASRTCSEVVCRAWRILVQWWRESFFASAMPWSVGYANSLWMAICCAVGGNSPSC